MRRALYVVQLLALLVAGEVLAQPGGAVPINGGCQPGGRCAAAYYIATATQGTATSQCLVSGGTGSSGVCLGGYPGAGAATLYLGVTPSARDAGNWSLWSNGGSLILNAPSITGNVHLRRGGSSGWTWDGTAFSPDQNNVFDLGTTLNRVRSGYFSGSMDLTGPLNAQGVAIFSAGISQNDNNGAQGVRIEDNVGLSIVGVPTASLVACNATAPGGPNGTRGSLQFDTTTNTLKYCNGTAWVVPLTTAPTEIATWSAFKPGAVTEAAPLVGPLQAVTTGTVNRIACTWDTAGSGGTTAITVRVFDVTAALSLGTFSLGACNTAAHVPLIASGAGTLTASNNYRLEVVSSGDCTTKPSNMMCNVNVTY